MKSKIKYAVFVKADVNKAVKWYNKAQIGLGDRFIKNLKEKINYIAQNPESIQERYKNVQMAMITNFPYSIHFQYFKKENTLFILGVFHTSLNPDKWENRL